MTNYIDRAFWRKNLSKPDWYIPLVSDFTRLDELADKEKDYDKRKAIKNDAWIELESAIKDGRLTTANSGENPDVERKTIDTIVIHHTNNRPRMTLDRLNAMHTLLLYGKYYKGLTDYHESIWSGHFYRGEQVFWAYHWFVREDGSYQQILSDKYIGWHAGNWDINTRSIAICIDDDLNDKEPNGVVIHAITEIISNHYPSVKPENIVGHCDVYDTKCPGRLFNQSWRQKIIDQIKNGEKHDNQHQTT
jgi:hypothetical protein